MLILVIGDGDFSFSLAVAQKHDPAHILCLVATSLETQGQLAARPRAFENIGQLLGFGATVLHGVDGTHLKHCIEIRDFGEKFDAIIFNSPHTGGKGNIKANRQLLHDFFKSAVEFIKQDGEISITLCKGQGGTPADCTKRGYSNSWKVVEMAAESGLILTRVMPFSREEYPSYCPSGYRGQSKGFMLDGALIHTFTLPRVNPSFDSWKRIESGSCDLCLQCFEKTRMRTFHFLESEEALEYPILLQPWHPVSLIKEMLLEALNCLWKTTKCSTHHRIKLHLVPSLSDCIPEETTARIISDSSDAQNTSVVVSQPTLELEIPVIAKNLQQDCSGKSSTLRVICRPVLRDAPISLSPGKQPVSHEVLGLTSCETEQPRHEASSLPQQVDENYFKRVLVTAIHRVLIQSPLLANRVQEADLTWSCMSNTPLLSRCSALKLNVSGDCVIPVGRCGISEAMPSSSEAESSVSEVPSSSEVPSCSEVPSSSSREKPSSTKTPLLAFMIHLEPLAMIYFGIKDVRLLSSKDGRFSAQFLTENPRAVTFRPFSLYPPTYIHDISFWCKQDRTNTGVEAAIELQIVRIIREVSKGNVASLACIDTYCPSDSERVGYCYRVVYQSADRALARSEALELQLLLRDRLVKQLDIVLR